MKTLTKSQKAVLLAVAHEPRRGGTLVARFVVEDSRPWADGPGLRQDYAIDGEGNCYGTEPRAPTAPLPVDAFTPVRFVPGRAVFIGYGRI